MGSWHSEGEASTQGSVDGSWKRLTSEAGEYIYINHSVPFFYSSVNLNVSAQDQHTDQTADIILVKV